MQRSDRLGLVLALPGIALAAVVYCLLAYSNILCDPLYEPNRLLEPGFLREINKSAARDLGGTFEAPPRPAIKLTRELNFPASCYRVP